MQANQEDSFPEPHQASSLGMWLFIISEIMLFGGFIAAYFALRWGNADCALGTPAWPKAGYTGGLLLATANTVVLLTSSYTMVRAVLAAKAGKTQSHKSFLLATVLLGVAFLVVKGMEYSMKIGHGYFPGSDVMAATPGLNIFVSAYFAMTGFHGLHIVAGLVWLGFLWTSAGKPLDEKGVRRTEFAGLYWHFVDVVWVVLFPLFYLI